MKVSVCVTSFNESEDSIQKLLSALSNQTLKADEVIMVDAGTSPISNSQFLIFNQFLIPNFQLLHKRGVSRARGRNIAIKKAKNNIIAITDVGCIPHKKWLEEITKPFEKKNIDVVAGVYKMISINSLQDSMKIFLGVPISKIDKSFMPSARSMAFTKNIWKKAGGFPKNLNDTAEDTLFNINLIKAGANYVVAKKAIVDWQMPDDIFEFAKKIYKYAKGDAQSGIWWHQKKGFGTHNIKVLTIFLRYILFFYFPYLFLIYILYAFYKASWWGIVLQISSDFACIIGFSHGILQSSFKRY